MHPIMHPVVDIREMWPGSCHKQEHINGLTYHISSHKYAMASQKACEQSVCRWP